VRWLLNVVASERAYRLAHGGVNILAGWRDTAIVLVALGKCPFSSRASA
jgi:hypothetical protein